ncbi:MAG: hypothetical protein WBC44_05880 [Planctomycetaceae bacterium]
MTTGRPFSQALYFFRHFPAPPGLQVATQPIDSSRSTSLSPSTTKMGVPGFAARILGSR